MKRIYTNIEEYIQYITLYIYFLYITLLPNLDEFLFLLCWIIAVFPSKE